MNVTTLRKDFPILNRPEPPVYLDSACTTLKPQPVLDALMKYYTEFSACAGRSAHALGTQVSMAIDEARARVAGFIGATDAGQVVFTKNATEGLNLVAAGFPFEKGDRVLLGQFEHNSNLVPWHRCQERLGRNDGLRMLEPIPMNSAGEVDMDGYIKALENGIRMVAFSGTSNLTGVTQPIKKMARIAHEYDTLVLLDGAQYVPHHQVDVKELEVDLMAFSGHKLLGPTGIGVLWGQPEVLEQMEPLVAGGGSIRTSGFSGHELLEPPERFEGGTQNHAGILGLRAALDYLEAVGMDNIQEHETKLNRILTEGTAGRAGLKILGPKDHEKRGAIFNFAMDGFDHHDMALALEAKSNIMVRSGHHCQHTWFHENNIPGSTRASVYLYNSEEEMRLLVDTLENISKNLPKK